MANQHYANIGDVWKHLPLSQILHAEQPARYWESHAGNAVYTLERDPARDYGLIHFLRAGAEVELLKDSIYYRIAARFVGNDPPLYSGSPALAMALLGASDTDFLFCDKEADSILNLGAMAGKLGVPRERLRMVHGDGLKTLIAAAQATRETDLPEVLAFLDPYQALVTEADHTGLNCFCDLSALGIQTVLWYGYQTEEEQRLFHAALAQELKERQLDPVTHNLWIGEIRLVRIQGFYDDFHPGVLGCGLLCANLSSPSLKLCTELGQALEGIYAGVRLPDGQRGDLQFTHAGFGGVIN